MSPLIQLLSPTSDLISSISFNSSNTLLHIASWDGKVVVYDVEKILAKYHQQNDKTRVEDNQSVFQVDDESVVVGSFDTGSSILDSCWDDEDEPCIYTGNVNGVIYKLNIEHLSRNRTDCAPSLAIGQQCKLAIQAVKFHKKTKILAAISWDKTLQLIDTRKKNPGGIFGSEIILKSLSRKPFSMDLNKTTLVVSLENNTIQIYNLQWPNAPLVQERESGLRWQTREVKISGGCDDHDAYIPGNSSESVADKENAKQFDENLFVQSSFEGRIIVDYIDSDPAVQENKFAFKCHRVTTSDNLDLVSPINSIVLFQEPPNVGSETAHNLLYTGGSDGIINLWDLNKKKKVKKLKKFDQSVLKMCISNTSVFPSRALLLPLQQKLPDDSAIGKNVLLAIVTGDDGFKNNRYLDNGKKDNSISENSSISPTSGIGDSIGSGGMTNVKDFDTKVFIKLV